MSSKDPSSPLPTPSEAPSRASVGHTSRRVLPSPSHRALLVACGALVALALTACGMLIPDQSVGNPLGLDGQTIAITFPAPATLVAQAVQGDAEADFAFQDFETDISALPVSPAELANELSIESASLSGDPATAPESITLSDAVVVLQIWHDAASYGDALDGHRTEVTAESQGAITLERDTCSVDACTYSYGGATPAFGVASFTGSQLAAGLTIFTQAPTTNSGHVALTLTGEPDSLAGRTLTITVDASQGKLKF